MKDEKKDEATALQANGNFFNLRNNSYPGRGIVMGVSENGKVAVIIYWMMGRSEGSRNRIFQKDRGGMVRTAVADPTKQVGDPALTLYPALMDSITDRTYAVSNGKQTEDVLKDACEPKRDYSTLCENWKYENDSPNFTPRISGAIKKVGDQIHFDFIIQRKSPSSMDCIPSISTFSNISPGLGYCIHTYDKDSDPLPGFSGTPFIVPITGKNPDEIIEKYWNALDSTNRVGIVMKVIDLLSGGTHTEVINQYEAVPA